MITRRDGFYVVTLEPEDLAEIDELAGKRNSTQADNGVRENKHCTRYGRKETNGIGLYGEMGYEIYPGIPLDRSRVIGGDGGLDGRWRGWTCQIKTAGSPGFKTQYVIYDDEVQAWKPDITLLALKLSDREVQLMGWIYGMDFLGKWHARNFSYGDRMVVPPTLLNPVDMLFDLPDISTMPY